MSLPPSIINSQFLSLTSQIHCNHIDTCRDAEVEAGRAALRAECNEREGLLPIIYVANMRPTLNLNFRNGARDFQVALHSPMQGFDSLRIISQVRHHFINQKESLRYSSASLGDL